MPRQAVGLSAAKAAKAGPGEYVDGQGLRLQVKATGARSWVFRFTIAGRTREMGLGGAGTAPGYVSLAEARRKVGHLRRLVNDGTDPLARRDAQSAAARALAQTAAIEGITFRTVADAYIKAHAPSWRSAIHRKQWENSLETYVHPHVGAIPVADVSAAHVVAILEPIWQAKPETAARVRGRLETVLDYARARDWRTGENPARWRGHLDHVLPARAKFSAVVHHAALPWTEIAAFMAELRRLSSMSALALEFCILTAARTGEVLGARWNEIDHAATIWTVPAARMKAGAEHRVPLTPPAMATLQRLAELRTSPSPDACIFASAQNTARAMSNMAMAMTLRRMKRDDLTVHGFRSTFRDWAAERTDYPREVAEAALAHTIDNKVEAAYRRGDLFDKRAGLMKDWSAFCSNPAVPT